MASIKVSDAQVLQAMADLGGPTSCRELDELLGFSTCGCLIRLHQRGQVRHAGHQSDGARRWSL